MDISAREQKISAGELPSDWQCLNCVLDLAAHMRKISAAILVVLALGIAVAQQTKQPHFATSDTGISVHLHQPHGSFVAGQSVQVQVNLYNEGKQTLIVCRKLEVGNQSCFWDFEMRDASGHMLPTGKLAVDSIPGPPAPFPEALISNWIALAPKYQYGTMLWLDFAFPPKPRPGNYKVRAILHSLGPSGDLYYNDVRQYPEELAKLPYAGWNGKAVSNWISVTIVAAK